MLCAAADVGFLPYGVDAPAEIEEGPVGKQYDRNAFVEIVRFLAPGRDDHVRAIQRRDHDDALQELLIRLEANRKIVRLDSKEPLDQVIARLRSLFMYPTEMNLRWTKTLRAKFEAYGPGTDVEKLLEYIGARSLAVGTALVEIDTQTDSYALAFVSARRSHELAAVAPGHIGTIPRQHVDPGLPSTEAQQGADHSSSHTAPDLGGQLRSGTSWMAVYLLESSAETILDELGLVDTGTAYTPGRSALGGAVLPKWLVIVDHHADRSGYVGKTELLQRLSEPGTYTVACYHSADTGQSSAVQWFGGTQWWSVQHDPSHIEGPDHLDYWGNLYWDFAKIRAAAWKKHKAARDHRHLYQVPLTAASQWTGFAETMPLTELIERG
ncbi:hypothetical protein [Nocardia sp. NPDC050406]|uniref:DUF6630 family protein n=1 Tax=Nocardia sp. NPDC050406 TaxID=3364318 RepID=UPI0037B53DE4